jgi:hypothetical protein
MNSLIDLLADLQKRSELSPVHQRAQASRPQSASFKREWIRSLLRAVARGLRMAAFARVGRTCRPEHGVAQIEDSTKENPS